MKSWPISIFHFISIAAAAPRRRDDADHIRDLIYQVLFTSPGERVMRPNFGSGLLQLVFAPNSDELAATTQLLAQAALQQWLGDLIVVEAVERGGGRCDFAGDRAVRRAPHRRRVRPRPSSTEARRDLLLLR